MKRESIVSRKRIRATLREQKALELRLSGKYYHEIATDMKMSIEGVRQCVLRAMDRLLVQVSETAEEVKQLELARLDAMLRGLWVKALRGDVRSIGAALSIMDRRARYLGLDAPKLIEVDWRQEIAKLQEAGETEMSASEIFETMVGVAMKLQQGDAD